MELPLTFICCDSQVKWHEICLSTPAAILEVLNAWENGVLSVEAVQVCLSLMLYFFFCFYFFFLWLENTVVRFPKSQLLIWYAGCIGNLPDHCMSKNFLFPTFEVWLITQVRIRHTLWKLTNNNVLRTCNSSDVPKLMDETDASFFPLFHSSFQIT